MFLSNDTILDDKYRIRGTIGSGGMGIVYEALQADMDRLVALKLLTYAPSDDQNELKRFEREAIILSRLSHPNIVQFHAYGMWRIYPYLAMEKLSGISLHEFLADYETGIDAGLALKIAIEVCLALEHAHEVGVLHRDIKPSNIILTSPHNLDKPSLKVIDFGLARLTGVDGQQKLTQTGKAMGSVMYMSPEQCVGGDVNARVDIYAVGCLLYECLTGQPPFLADNGVAVMFQHINEPVSKSERFNWLTPKTQALIQRCMAKKPKDRYANAADLRTDLEDLLKSGAPCLNQNNATRTPPVRVPGSAPLTAGTVSPARLRLLVPAMACLLLIAATALVIWLQHHHESETGGTAPGDDLQRITNASIAYSRADLLFHLEQFEQAARAYARADQLATEYPDKTSLISRCQIKHHLAQTLHRLNRIEEAGRIYEQGAPLVTQIPPTDQCDFYKDWTYTLFSQNKVAEARVVAEKAVTAAEAVLKEYGENSNTNRLYSEALARLAEAYEGTNDWKKAEPLRRKALALTKTQSHPDVVSASMINLAKNLNQQRKPEGMQRIQEWLDWTESVDVPASDTNYLCTKIDGLCMLAELEQKRGQSDLALRHYKYAVDTASKVQGQARNHQMAVSLAHLAGHYYKTGKTEIADKTWSEARQLMSADNDSTTLATFTPRIERAKRTGQALSK